jgi:hypothetical protein
MIKIKNIHCEVMHQASHVYNVPRNEWIVEQVWWLCSAHIKDKVVDVVIPVKDKIWLQVYGYKYYYYD